MDIVQSDIQVILKRKELFEAISDSTILITGATGLIGSMIVKTLVAADEKYNLGIKIIAQIRNEEKARKVLESVLDKIELSFIYDVPTDLIIHTVSPTKSKYFIEHPVETIKSSVESTISILEIAKKYKAKVVYLSSMEQYGIPYESGMKMTEDKIGIIDHLNVRSSYSESKRMCECLCASYASEYDIDVKIARLAQTGGAGIPLTDNRMPIQFARAVIDGKDIVLHTEGKSITNYVYLTDAIVGIFIILLKGKAGQAYNICNDKETKSVREIAEMVCHDVAADSIKVRIERNDNMGYAPDVAMYMDSRKLRNLGWDSEIKMADGYRKLINYLKMQNDN